MKNGIFMIGAPAAGKSTWIERNVPSNYHIVNPDDINTEQFSGKIQTLYQAYLKACDILRNDILPKGEDFVFDGTASNPTNLKRLYKAAKEEGYYTSLFFVDADIFTCVYQNHHRPRRLPLKAIVSTWNKVQESWRKVSKWDWDEIKKINQKFRYINNMEALNISNAEEWEGFVREMRESGKAHEEKHPFVTKEFIQSYFDSNEANPQVYIVGTIQFESEESINATFLEGDKLEKKELPKGTLCRKSILIEKRDGKVSLIWAPTVIDCG